MPSYRYSLFHGHASAAEARVYFELRDLPLKMLAEIHLSGSITGPKSKFARTLSAKFPLRELTPGETLLAEAIIPDPCFWTPESPYVYEVEVTGQLSGDEAFACRQLFGIRPLGVKGKSFYLDGKRWVVRGGKVAQLEETRFVEAREVEIAFATMSVGEPGELAAASEQGVFVVGWLVPRADPQAVSEETRNPNSYEVEPNEATDEVLLRLQELAHWPAVGMVILDAALDETEVVKRRPRNLLLGERLRMSETHPEFQPSSWAHFIVADVDDPALFAAQTAHLQLPVVAYREAEPDLPPTAIRAACERLQQDLAPHGDFAGYLV